METTIIKTFQGKLVIGTWDLSLFVRLQHRLLKITANRFFKQLSSLSLSMEKLSKNKFPTKRRNQQVGAPIYEYLLEANQVKFILSVLPSRGKCLEGKIFLISNSHLSDAEFFHKLEELLG